MTTNNIGRIIGGGHNYIGGFGAKKQEEAQDANVKDQVVNKQPETQVDANKVLDYMANNTLLVGVTNKTNPVELDPKTEARIEEYMKGFEAFVLAAEEEVGFDNALLLADLRSEAL